MTRTIQLVHHLQREKIMKSQNSISRWRTRPFSVRAMLTLSKRAAVTAVLGLANFGAAASTYQVLNTYIKVYAASESAGATAHLIESSNAIYNGGSHPWCGYRAYIDVNDKALMATALAAAISGVPVSFVYDDYAAPKEIPGHANGFSCKVISIFQL
jgi:hypothetical protein